MRIAIKRKLPNIILCNNLNFLSSCRYVRKIATIPNAKYPKPNQTITHFGQFQVINIFNPYKMNIAKYNNVSGTKMYVQNTLFIQVGFISLSSEFLTR